MVYAENGYNLSPRQSAPAQRAQIMSFKRRQSVTMCQFCAELVYFREQFIPKCRLKSTNAQIEKYFVPGLPGALLFLSF